VRKRSPPPKRFGLNVRPRPVARPRAANVYKQCQPGYVVATVTCPLGDLTSVQMRRLAEIAHRFVGDTVRTTFMTRSATLVWPVGWDNHWRQVRDFERTLEPCQEPSLRPVEGSWGATSPWWICGYGPVGKPAPTRKRGGRCELLAFWSTGRCRSSCPDRSTPRPRRHGGSSRRHSATPRIHRDASGARSPAGNRG
jgi:Nitrite/Sulfite reductase ferredoxin-like half domain